MTFYAIRHKPTNTLMPQLRRGKGYSHWNPPTETLQHLVTGVPRLFKDRRNATNCIAMWFAFPNAYKSYNKGGYYGDEYDEIIDNKKDDRKKEDLEVVEIEVDLEKAYT